MSIFDHIDFSRGTLPGWINNLVALTRPLANTLTISIAPVGAFSVGFAAIFSPGVADAMATASIKFLQGIPDAGYGAIVAISLGYTAAKSAEVVKAGGQQPQGPAPDTPPAQPQIFDTTKLEIPHPDFAPRPPAQPTETME